MFISIFIFLFYISNFTVSIRKRDSGQKSLFVAIPPNIFIFFYNPRLSIHELISDSDAPPWNRSPSFQSPVPVISSRRLPLSPIPEVAAVQNGMTVFPVKSFSFTKLSTGHAAIPHQIGYLKCSQFPSCVDFTGFNCIQNCVYCYYLSFFSKIALKHRPHYFHI